MSKAGMMPGVDMTIREGEWPTVLVIALFGVAAAVSHCDGDVATRDRALMAVREAVAGAGPDFAWRFGLAAGDLIRQVEEAEAKAPRNG